MFNEIEIKKEIEFKMNEICKYISSIDIKLISSGMNDGRIDSLTNEKEIVKKIIDKFPSFTRDNDNNRGQDFEIYIDIIKDWIETNVKMIFEETGTNIGGGPHQINKLLYDPSKGANWTQLLKKFGKKKFTDKYTDYLYFYYFKNNGSCGWISIYDFNEEAFRVNPSNPFQAEFHKIKPINRTINEGRKWIMSKTVEVILKQSERYLILKNNGIV